MERETEGEEDQELKKRGNWALRTQYHPEQRYVKKGL